MVGVLSGFSLDLGSPGSSGALLGAPGLSWGLLGGPGRRGAAPARGRELSSGVTIHSGMSDLEASWLSGWFHHFTPICARRTGKEALQRMSAEGEGSTELRGGEKNEEEVVGVFYVGQWYSGMRERD